MKILCLLGIHSRARVATIAATVPSTGKTKRQLRTFAIFICSRCGKSHAKEKA